MAKFKGAKSAKVGVEGSAELLNQLTALDEAMATMVLDDAVLGGALVMQTEMQRRAPRDRGVLASNIQVKRSGKPTRYKAAWNIGPSKKAAHAIPVELGHNLVRVLKDGTRKVIGYVAPVPFMRNAYHAKKNEAVKAIADSLRGQIERLKWLK